MAETHGDLTNDPKGEERRKNGDYSKLMQSNESVNLVGRLRRILLAPADPKDPSNKFKRADNVVTALVVGAEGSSISHIREIFERLEGKVADKSVVLSGDDLKEMTDEQLDKLLNIGNSNVANISDIASKDRTDEPNSSPNQGGEG